jgi:hypothetical protein
VQCRENMSGRAFTRPEDLDQVKGIGPAKIAALREWLAFPQTQAAEKRSSDDGELPSGDGPEAGAEGHAE